MEPIMRVKLDETFTVPITNAFGREIVSPADFQATLEEKKGHPVFGPIYIEGLKLGDCLEVYIKEIKVNSPAYQCVSKSTGVLKDRFTERNFQIYSIKDNKYSLGNIDWPVRPSVGFIATLPPEEMSGGRASRNGGNLDFHQIDTGSSLILPVTFECGLLFLGDLHVSQGNGEICGIAVESSGEVTLTIKKSSRKVNFPVLEKASEIVVIGTGATTEESAQAAVENALIFYEQNFSWKREETYLLLSAQADLIFGNFTGKVKTCGVALDLTPKYEKDMKIIERIT